MKKYLATAATVLTVGLIAGCGSSGTGTPTTSVERMVMGGTPTISISGKVADGYLIGATVFMDKNGNYQLDPGEPSATTDHNGAYTLMNVDPADVGKYPIVAIATKGMTIDKDTGVPVTGSYLLSMPASAISGMVSSNFISPMSTQLREMMETGKYATMQQAMSDLSAKLGMPAGTNMLVDYMAANNKAMHTAAQNMASLMGSQMAQVLGKNGSTTTVDVNRYRSMMGTIFSNMSSIKGSDAQSGMPNPMGTNFSNMSSSNGSNSRSAMSNLMGTMTANLVNIAPGLPFRNMSAAFRGGLMGGTKTTTATVTMPTTGGMMR